MSRVDDLYARFESRFRGSRESILERLGGYAPLLAIVEDCHVERTAIDCGCGRGEWLQLLEDRGWTARGVDTNQRMLDEARAHHLDVVHGDAIAFLGGLPSRSVHLLSAFHLAEHLSTELLLMLLAEMSRVIADHGVVLLETPNPENIAVGTSSFYLDPTHNKPLPPLLLQFYVEQSGLQHAHVLRVNGEADAGPGDTLQSALRPLLHRAPDYAVVGLRTDDAGLAEAVAAFVEEVGQESPIALDRVIAFDQMATVRRDADRQAESATRSAIFETRDALHTALIAVHNATTPIAGRIDATVRQNEGLLAAVHESRDALHAAIHQSRDALHAAILAVYHTASPMVDATERLGAQLAEQDRRLTALTASLDATREQVERQLAASSKTLQSSLREALTTTRRNADAREFRMVSALDALRRSNALLAADREAVRPQAANPLSAHERDELVRETTERTAALYTSSTSWRITAPLRAMIGGLRAPGPAAAVPPAPGSAPVRHRLLSNRYVWAAGKRVARVVPGLRSRLLRSLDRRNLLVNPLAESRIDAHYPLSLFRDEEHDELDETQRMALLPQHARDLYLRMTRPDSGGQAVDR